MRRRAFGGLAAACAAALGLALLSVAPAYARPGTDVGSGAARLQVVSGRRATAGRPLSQTTAPSRMPAAGSVAGPGVPVTLSLNASKPTAGQVDEDLLGVNHVVAGSGPALRAIGVKWARTDVSFEAVVNGVPVYNCATGAWDPTYLDSHVALDRAAGATPVLIVDYTPPCLATNPPPGVNPNYTPPDVGPDAAKWDALVYQMALHEIGVEHVRTFEIWNEPNGFTFWTGTMQDYLTLYQNTAGALEEAAHALHVHVLVGGPAMADFGATPDLAWVDGLLSFAETTHVPVDFLSWHLYANDPYLGPGSPLGSPLCFGQPAAQDGACWYNPYLRAESYGESVQLVRAEVAKYPGLHPLLWLDEWNVDAGYDLRQSSTFGAAFAAAALDSAQSSGLDRMTFYDAADDQGNPDANFGLLTTALAPKPDYEVMYMWHRLAGTLLSVHESPDQSGADPFGRVGAVASIGKGGVVQVMVYNFAPEGPTGTPAETIPASYDHDVTVRVGGLCDDVYTATQSLVDTTHDGAARPFAYLVGPTAKVSFDLEGQGVSFLQLRPSRGPGLESCGL